MSEPYIGEIKMWAGNFAPRGYVFCNGGTLSISQNTALFSIIGTTYGGDGRTTMGIPDLQGRIPMHPGNGPGLTSRRLGEKGGVTDVTLSEAQMASHSHALQGTNATATGISPGSHRPARSPDENAYSSGTAVAMSTETLAAAGGGQSHTNVQPYLPVAFILAVEGTFPQRS